MITPTLNGSDSQLKVVSEFLHELETKYDLFRFEIDGWCAWTILRPSIARFVSLNNSKNQNDPHLGLNLLDLLTLTLSELPKFFSIPRTTYVLKSHSSALRDKEGNFHKDIFIDDLFKKIERSRFFKIEDINVKAFVAHSRNALIKKDISTAPLATITGILSLARVPIYIKGISRKIAALLHQEEILKSFKTTQIDQKLYSFYWSKKIYGWLFDQLCPKYIVMPTHGEYSMVAAAKERNIEVIEFQHGSPSRKKIPYSWSSNAAQFKSKIPIPDRIFLYGEYFRQELRATGFWDKELCIVGSLRMDQYRDLRSTIQSKRKKNKINILITTQGIDVEKVIKFISEFLDITIDRLNVSVYFKLQPNFEKSKDNYEAAFKTYENVHILLGNEPPSTFELLAQADFHLSIYSTTHYEALGFGIPTIILPFTNHDIVLPLHESGHAFLAKTPGELFELIEKNQKCVVPPKVSQFYLKPNALNNMSRILNL